MRIAVLTTSYPRSPGDPAGHFVQAETRALCRAGHDVWVIAPGEHGSVVTGSPNLVWLASGSAFGWPGVAARLRENPLRALGVAAYFAAAGRELYERGPFDRIVAHWLVPSGFPLALAAPGKGELEVVAHGSDVRLLLKAPRLARFALQRLLARARSMGGTSSVPEPGPSSRRVMILCSSMRLGSSTVSGPRQRYAPPRSCPSLAASSSATGRGAQRSSDSSRARSSWGPWTATSACAGWPRPTSCSRRRLRKVRLRWCVKHAHSGPRWSLVPPGTLAPGVNPTTAFTSSLARVRNRPRNRVSGAAGNATVTQGGANGRWGRRT